MREYLYDIRTADFRPYKGFSLLEVLVALFVLSVGLLGLATLQTIGLRFNHESYERTQAVLQVYDIIDRIRANKVNGPGSSASSTYDSVALGNKPTVSTDCETATCTTAQMATYDINKWNTANSNLLPDGKGAICRGTFDGSYNCATDGSTYRIAIQWKEKDGNKTLQIEAVP